MRVFDEKRWAVPTVGPLSIGGQVLSDDPVSMAEVFASLFESVYSLSSPQGTPAPHQMTSSQMVPIHMTLQDVHDKLQALDLYSAVGPDDLHPALLKSCSKSLAYPLYKIMCPSLAEAHLPAEWKSSIIVPVFKKVSLYNPLSYRPISLTSIPSKVLERIIVDHCNSYL